MARSLRHGQGIIVAAGTLAAVPLIPSLADTPYRTNHQAVEVKDLPAALVVLGGPIGLEPRACGPIGDLTGDGPSPTRRSARPGWRRPAFSSVRAVGGEIPTFDRASMTP